MTNVFTTKLSLKKDYSKVYANKMMASDAPTLPYSIDWSKVQNRKELEKALKFDKALYKKMKSLKDLKGEVADKVAALAEHLSLFAAKLGEGGTSDETLTYIGFQVEQHLLRTWNKLSYEQRLEADKALAEKTGVPAKMKERDAKRAEREQAKAKAPKKEKAPKKAEQKKQEPQSNEAQILQLLQSIVANQQDLNERISKLEQKRSRKAKKTEEGA